jgi:peptidoglycan/xylan/chitin deacetylase (PgdA/CDA1 family)
LLLGVCAFVCALVGSVVIPTSTASAAPGAGQDTAAKPVLYLTFDDGPGEDTPAFLDLLARHDIDATFFVTGAAVAADPATTVRMVDEGHVVANHTWNHPRLSSLGDAAIADQFTRTNEIIEATIGMTPVCYRPPYGATNDRVHAQAVAAGLPNAEWTTGRADSHHGLWDVDTNDWRLSLRSSSWTPSRMRARLDAASNGDTVLLHDGFSNRRRGLAVLSAWLDDNADRFEFRTLPGCDPRPSSLDDVAVVEPALNPEHPEQWHRARIARLYLAYFDRLPDADGWEYWNRQHTTGQTLGEISYWFTEGSEFKRTEILTDEEFVTFVYRQVLNRDPDADGFAYWLDQLAGDLNRGELMLYFSDGAEFIRTSAPTLTGDCHQGDTIAAYRCWVATLPTYDW